MNQELTRFTVMQRRDGIWKVYESGLDRPLGTFVLKNDAVEYALRFAATRKAWKVEVVDADEMVSATFDGTGGKQRKEND